MKCFWQKVCLLFLFFIGAATSGWSQNLTGIWRGSFRTEMGDTYKLELQIKQSSTGFKGVTYSYLNTVFYGKATIMGSFNKAGQSAMIKELKTVELKMSSGSVACIMKYLLDYSKSGKEEFLEGVYSSVHEKDSYGSKKGEDCGSGIVRLRKVQTSDFYIEPFLRNPAVASKPTSGDSLINRSPVKKVVPPVAKKTTVPPTTAKTNPVNKSSTTKTTTGRPPVASTKLKPKVEPPAKKLTAPTRNNPDSLAEKKVITQVPRPTIPTPAVLKSRQNELMKSLIVNNPAVTVKLFDNGEIDGDTISVYLDKKLVLSNKRLTAAPLTIQLTMDEENPDHELVMVAENLGRIPPNTSLMIVEAGEQRFEVRITSTEQKNAVVKFRYQKSP